MRVKRACPKQRTQEIAHRWRGLAHLIAPGGSRRIARRLHGERIRLPNLPRDGTPDPSLERDEGAASGGAATMFHIDDGVVRAGAGSAGGASQCRVTSMEPPSSARLILCASVLHLRWRTASSLAYCINVS